MTTRRDARLAYATTAVGISAVSLIAPSLPELAAIYGVTVGEVAAIQVAVLVPGIFSARWLLGRGSDRGLSRMLALALLGYGLFGSSLLFVSSWPLVLSLRVLQGFFCGGLVAGAFALLGRGGEDGQRRIARNAALVCVMMAIQPLVGSFLNGFGPRWPFAFYLTALPLGVAMLRRSRGDTLAVPRVVATADDTLGEAKPRTGEALLVTGVINALLFGWLLYLAPVHLAESYGAGVGVRGVVLSAQAALGAVLALAVARYLVRGRQRPLLYIGVLIPMAGLLIVAAEPMLIITVIGFLLIGATYGAANPAVISILAGQGRRATGAWQSTARIGQVIGPACAGWLVERAGVRDALLTGVALGAVGLLRLLWRDCGRWSASRSTMVQRSGRP